MSGSSQSSNARLVLPPCWVFIVVNLTFYVWNNASAAGNCLKPDLNCVTDQMLITLAQGLRIGRQFEHSRFPSDVGLLRTDVSVDLICDEVSTGRPISKELQSLMEELTCPNKRQRGADTHNIDLIIYSTKPHDPSFFAWNLRAELSGRSIDKNSTGWASLDLHADVPGDCPSHEELKTVRIFGEGADVFMVDGANSLSKARLRGWNLTDDDERTLNFEMQDHDLATKPFCSFEVTSATKSNHNR